MKKARTAAILFAAAILACGCMNKAEPEIWQGQENSIYVAGDHHTESALVYTAPDGQTWYQEHKLQEFAQAEVDAYNEKAGSNAVTLKTCSLEGSTGRLVFSYETPEDLVAFAGETQDDTHTLEKLQVASAGEISVDGLTFFTRDGKAADEKKAMSVKEGIMIVAKGAATICTEGRVRFVSDGVTVRSDYSVVTPEGISCIVFR